MVLHVRESMELQFADKAQQERFHKRLDRPDDDLIVSIIKRVAELPNRSSPDDWPDAMLVTAEELEFIIRSELNPD